MTAYLVFAIGLLCLVPPIPSLHWPGMAPWAGLVAGVAVALASGNPFRVATRRWSHRLLAWSVVGLGAAMDLRVVLHTGLHGFGYTLVGIMATLLLGVIVLRLLQVSRDAGLLIAIGTAICGGSAIAAAAPVLQAREEDTSVALGTVFLLNAAALLLFPAIGSALHLPERAFGLWSALAIHDTSSVVGASAGYGPVALAIATTTKLARALWIVPLTLLLGLWVRRRGRAETTRPGARRPWFILGFLATATLVTFVPMLRSTGQIVSEAARRALVLTLFLLGLGLERKALAMVGVRPLLMGVVLWLLVGGASLVAVASGWIR